jgi:hypothetical protein
MRRVWSPGEDANPNGRTVTMPDRDRDRDDRVRDSRDPVVIALAKRVADLEQVVTAATRRPRDDDGGPGPVRDAMWRCEKCQRLLGFYDKETDVLRIRYKEHLEFVRIGVGGFIQVVCKDCGHPNEQVYATPEEVAATESARTVTRLGKS